MLNRKSGSNIYEEFKRGLWSSRLRNSFLPVIRERGERYARNGRVVLREFSRNNITATVLGTVAYDVELYLSEDMESSSDIRTSCTCPFFRQGFPCKHLWAAIMEADRLLEGEGTDRVSTESPGAGNKTGKIDRSWRRFFCGDAFNAPEPATAPEYSPGNFVPVYSLYIGERELLFSAVERYVKKDGTLGRKRKISQSATPRGSFPVADRLLMAVVEEISRKNGYAGSYYSSGTAMYEDILLEKDDLEVILPLLADTGRCLVNFWKKGVIADPLSKGVPFDAAFYLSAAGNGVSEEVAGTDRNDSLKLYPVFYLLQGDDSDVREIHRNQMDCIFNTDPLMFISDGRLHRVRDITFQWISEVYPLEYIEVSKEDIPEMLSAAEALPLAPSVDLPDDIAPVPVETVEPEGVLLLELDEAGASARFFVDYEGIEIDWQDRRNSILDPDRWIRIKRSRAMEQHFVMMLEEEGFRQDGGFFCRNIKGITSALDALGRQGFRLEASDRQKIRGGAVTSFKVSSGVDWFDLEGVISYGDEIIPLPRAMREFVKGNRTIRLGDGSVGILPEEWFSEHMSMLELGSPVKAAGGRGGKLRFPSTRVLLLDALLEEQDTVSLDRRFVELRDALKDFSGIEPQQVPAQFRGSLRPYQQDSLGWFAFLRKMNFGGILADDMGLGKTVQVLAWLSKNVETEEEDGGASRTVSPSLIVVPTSLVFNWESEAQRFVPEMKVLVYGGQGRKHLIEKIPEHHLVITTYGLMRRDIEELREIEFEYAILDESQAIKNSASQTAKAARLLNAANRLCLTGTPLENNVGELWSQMEFLNPGILGSRASFERRFLKPIDRDDDEALRLLKTIVKPFILRRTKELVASELPEKMEQTVFCTMPAAHADVYGKLRDHYRASILSSVKQNGINRSKIKVLEALLRLRQAASHPALVGYDDVHSGKLEELLQLVEEAVAGGHKALVFSQFTSMLALIRKSLDQRGIVYEYLDGRVPQKRREERVCRFQEDEGVKLFLISLKAGGVGLNLTAADYVFIVDPWWNPAVELQAVDRTHRIGQDKRVFTYRFITAETVEEKVLALQKQKQALVSSILSGSGDMLRNISSQDLEVLFS